jgi:hypothetical protein
MLQVNTTIGFLLDDIYMSREGIICTLLVTGGIFYNVSTSGIRCETTSAHLSFILRAARGDDIAMNLIPAAWQLTHN